MSEARPDDRSAPASPRDAAIEGRPIRVVVFPGAFRDPMVEEFCRRLEEHPEIELVGGVRQTPGLSWRRYVANLWRRRGPLAVPILLRELAGAAARWVPGPVRRLRSRRARRAVEERIVSVPDAHAPEVLERVREWDPDLGLIYGGPILRPELFEIPRLGTLGIHHGRLPDYRGKKTTFWEIYHGEPAAGVTIQRVNAGLDTGEVVTEGEVPIGRKPYRRVWREVQEIGLDLYVAAVVAMKRGTAEPRPPRGPPGPLYRDPGIRELAALWWRRSWGRPGRDRGVDRRPLS